MKVIAAGFPKTGTKSLGFALSKLGYGVIYDFVENGVYLHHEWQAIFNNGWDEHIFKAMYENVDVTIDIPASYFWEEISKAFPEAKIILTIRDEDEWFNSFEKHLNVGDESLLFRMLQILSPTQRRLLYGCGRSCGSKMFGCERIFDAKWFGRKLNEEMLKLKYRAHNAHVIQNAPKDKLLIFKVSEGWEPLCNFLNVPVPDEPFPHKNVKGAVLKEMFETHPIVLKMQREMMISLCTISGISIAVAFVVYRKGFHEITSWSAQAVSNLAGMLRLK